MASPFGQERAQLRDLAARVSKTFAQSTSKFEEQNQLDKPLIHAEVLHLHWLFSIHILASK
jgi:hypothetical protein